MSVCVPLSLRSLLSSVVSASIIASYLDSFDTLNILTNRVTPSLTPHRVRCGAHRRAAGARPHGSRASGRASDVADRHVDRARAARAPDRTLGAGYACGASSTAGHARDRSLTAGYARGASPTAGCAPDRSAAGRG